MRRWWWLGLLLVVVAATAGWYLWPRKGASEEEPPRVRFVDITESCGVQFTHHSGVTAEKFLPESMGSGVAIIDYDNDGLPDLFFVNSCPWPGREKGKSPTQALYRNLGKGKFEDVTRKVGLDVTLFGMGVAVGDVNNDGWPDLFISGVGGNRLFLNEKGPNGRVFRDVTSRAGVGGPGGWPGSSVGDFLALDKPLTWSTSAAFLDYDGDGKLDLFVCNYLTWSPKGDHSQGFRLATGQRAYGPPRAFKGAQCFLYRNLGEGRFENVSGKSGIEVSANGEPVGKSLGVSVCDVDEDGWPDIVVANDTVRNFFFHNEPDGKGGRRFREIGELSGVAYAERRPRGAMGIDWGPGYRKGRDALAIGNFADEPNTLLWLKDRANLQFIDVARTEGIAGPSRPLLKFGLFFFDHDLDGRLDLLTCNGHLEPDIARAMPEQSYAQPVQLFWNGGSRKPRFALVTEKQAGPDLFRPLAGRGCAHADLDGNGTLDVILTANGGDARVLRNEGGTGNHWVRFKLVGDGKRSNTSAIGARVVLEAGGRVQQREVTGARGYLSQSELTLTFGLGKTDTIDRVTIHWPGKTAGKQALRGVEVDREQVVRQR